MTQQYQPFKIITNTNQRNFNIPFNFTEDSLFYSVNGGNFIKVSNDAILNIDNKSVEFNTGFSLNDNLVFIRKSIQEPVSDLRLSSNQLNKEYTNIYNSLQELRYNYEEFRINLKNEIEDFEIQELNSLYKRGDVAIFNVNNVPEGWHPCNGALVSTSIAFLSDKGYPITNQGGQSFYQLPYFGNTLDSPDGTTRGYIKIRD